MDINKVWLSGLAMTQPVLTSLNSQTPSASFILQVNERFADKSGTIRQKPNHIKVESLGKNAETTASRVKQGQRYMVDGYFRQDTKNETDEIRVRTFAVYREESDDNVLYNEGLTQALEVLKRSRDIPSAINTLKELLAAQ